MKYDKTIKAINLAKKNLNEIKNSDSELKEEIKELEKQVSKGFLLKLKIKMYLKLPFEILCMVLIGLPFVIALVVKYFKTIKEEEKTENVTNEVMKYYPPFFLQLLIDIAFLLWLFPSIISNVLKLF